MHYILLFDTIIFFFNCVMHDDKDIHFHPWSLYLEQISFQVISEYQVLEGNGHYMPYSGDLL